MKKLSFSLEAVKPVDGEVGARYPGTRASTSLSANPPFKGFEPRHGQRRGILCMFPHGDSPSCRNRIRLWFFYLFSTPFLDTWKRMETHRT